MLFRLVINVIIIFILIFFWVTYDVSWTILVGVWFFASSFITKILKRKTIVIQDPKLGEIVSTSIDGWQVEWLVYLEIFDAEMKVQLSGNSKGISNEDRDRVLSIKENEEIYANESQRIISKTYEEAGIDFVDIQHHFIPSYVSIEEEETILTFVDRESLAHFNVIFLDNLATGYTMDT